MSFFHAIFRFSTALKERTNIEVLRILGHEAELVEEAVERICNIYLERASVYFPSDRINLILGDPHQIEASLHPRCPSA